MHGIPDQTGRLKWPKGEPAILHGRQETGVLLAMGMGASYVAGLACVKLLIMGSLGGLFGWCSISNTL